MRPGRPRVLCGQAGRASLASSLLGRGARGRARPQGCGERKWSITWRRLVAASSGLGEHEALCVVASALQQGRDWGYH